MKHALPRRRRGAVAVEMAMTLPLLLFIVFASVEFGRMNVIRHSVDNAAYEAARKVIVPGATAADADREARQLMNIVGARGVTVQLTPAVIQLDTPEITVEVSVRADQNGFIVPQFFGGKQLVGRCTLTRDTL
ncbi:MAG: TadE family protein [Planctomycetota bacterium]